MTHLIPDDRLMTLFRIKSRKQALSDGLRRYFVGRRCKYGHLSPRYTCTYTCVICNEMNRRKWMDNNFNYTKSRRRYQRQAIPVWSNLKQINHVYSGCPKHYEVDHIVPIMSDYVCGLHAPENLQYLSKSENASKSNRYWPYMPDELAPLSSFNQHLTNNKQKSPPGGKSQRSQN